MRQKREHFLRRCDIDIIFILEFWLYFKTVH